VKLKKTLKTLSSEQKNPKKNPKKPKKKPLGWVFLKKPGLFPTLVKIQQKIDSLSRKEYQCCGSGSGSNGYTCFWASRIRKRIRIH
jgi:hypothetical protein